MKYETLARLSTGTKGIKTDKGFVNPNSTVPVDTIVDLDPNDSRTKNWIKRRAIKTLVEKSDPRIETTPAEAPKPKRRNKIKSKAANK